MIQFEEDKTINLKPIRQKILFIIQGDISVSVKLDTRQEWGASLSGERVVLIRGNVMISMKLSEIERIFETV